MSVTITDTGLAAMINAQASGFDGLTLSYIDLYDSGQKKIKQLSIRSVQNVDKTGRVHITADDSSNDSYDFHGMHLLTDDSIVFAIVANDDNGVIQAKSTQTSLLLSFVIDLSGTPGTIVPSGEDAYYNFFATEEVQGIAEIATQPETDTGQDDTRIVTPKKLAGWWASIKNSLTVPSATEETEGIAKIATEEEYRDVNQDTTIITPKKLRNWWSWFTQNRSEARATETVRGVAKFATQYETNNAYSNLIVTPATLRQWYYDYLKTKFGSAAFYDAGDDYGELARIGSPSSSGYVGVIIDGGSNSRGQWRKYNDGTIIQWGKTPLGSYGNYFLEFPVAFSYADTISVVQSEITGYSHDYIPLLPPKTTGVTFCGLDSDQQYTWIAEGK